ncbi:MAG: AMP-binding protein, partial [Pseudomonadota bacterium]
MTLIDPTAWPLGAWVHRQAENAPDRTALVFEGSKLGYAAFAERISRLAGGLTEVLGLERGDRIAYLGRNHPDLLTLLFAAARLGLMVVPLNWRLAPPEREAILKDASPAALVVEAMFADHVAALAAEPVPWRPIALDFSKDGWLSIDDLLVDVARPDVVGMADDPLLIVYTSGTTGQAKGAVLSQGALRWNAANSVDMHDLTAADRILTALPLFHVGGLNIQTLPALAVGAEVLLEARFDPTDLLAQIANHKPTLTVLVPTMMKALIEHPDFEKTDLSSLRQITTGSSIVPTALIEGFHARGIPVTQ